MRAAKHDWRRFWTSVLCGASLVVGAWLLVWSGQLGRAHPNNAWIEAAIAHKLTLARAIEPPKTVILAGSGAMFGIDSGLLEAHLGRPAVNLGVNAGISLGVILETALPVMGEGDLVLLPLEYPLYNRREPVSEMLVHWMNSHPEMLAWLPAARALQVVAQTSPRRIVEGYRGLPEGFTVSGDYGPHRVDGRGDQLGTELEAREARHWQFLNQLPAERYGHQFAQGGLDRQRLQAFRDALLKRGACPVFLPATLAFEPSYRNDPVEHAFYASLGDRLQEAGLLWLGDPYAAMYPKQAFFDTNFHLHDSARQAHTQQVIEWLGTSPLAQCRRYYRSPIED